MATATSNQPGPMTAPRPAAGADAIVVDHLSHIYAAGNVVALDDVSVTIGHSEIVGIVGQNGSGKTTLAKHLNGLLKPTSGRVFVDGIDTTRIRVQQLATHAGYVFQNPNHQLFASTVEQDLAFGPRNAGVRQEEIDERVEQAITFFGLEDVRHLHPYRISFPMRKLVGIATIYTMRPTIFVLDEPTTGQDHVTTRVVNQLIHRLRDVGSTVVCVSHDMPLLAETVDRILVMWGGKLIADAPPREVFANAEIMRQTKLQPPQISEISLRLRSRQGRPAALTVDELAADLALDSASIVGA